MRKNNILGFTMAEMMVVFTIIGILAAILMPMANNARPDERVMKFKKGNTTLGNVIKLLVTSDQYYCDGNFAQKAKADGNCTNDVSVNYLCETFADVLNIKEKKCDNASTSASIWSTDKSYSLLDSYCIEYAESAIKQSIKTADGITYFFVGATNFANNSNLVPADLYGKIHNNYTILCVDVDTYNQSCCDDIDGSKPCTSKDKNLCPFGYGIIYDGKIVQGNQAQQWMKKSIHKQKNK